MADLRLHPFRIGVSIAALTAAFLVGTFTAGPTATEQEATTYRAPRSAYKDGRPDLSGIWMAMNTANWNLEDHEPGEYHPTIWRIGALFAFPGGQSVVEGGTIPYTPQALATKKEKFENRLVADVYRPEVGDTELKCYLPGLPRATYMPYPFELVQADRFIHFNYVYAGAERVVRMRKEEHTPSPVDTWMGWSNGRWDGETLEIEVTGFNGHGWLDRAGNFISDRTKVTERYTRTGPDHLLYEATLEDPTIYARPWKISMPLYRKIDRAYVPIEYRCIALSEEALYGRLTKIGERPTK